MGRSCGVAYMIAHHSDPTITGTIDRLHADGCTGRILGDDQRYYFMIWKNFARFGPLSGTKFSELRVGMRVRFIGAESGRAKDDPRAIEISVIALEQDGI